MRFAIPAAAVVVLSVACLARGDDAGSATATQTAPSEKTKSGIREAGGEELIQFDGGKLFLAWQAENDGDTIKEYIPAEQDLNTWTKLAAVRTFAKLSNARQFAEGMVEKLHEDSPDAPSNITENKNTHEVVLDFVAWPKDKSFAEFNVWKLRELPGGGIEADQFAVRDYQNPEGFVKNLKTLRERLIQAMAKEGLHVEQNN
jgi:hypothetical protein